MTTCSSIWFQTIFLFSPVDFKGNLSLLDIFLFFPRGHFAKLEVPDMLRAYSPGPAHVSRLGSQNSNNIYPKRHTKAMLQSFSPPLYLLWPKSVSHHFEAMVETIRWYLCRADLIPFSFSQGTLPTKTWLTLEGEQKLKLNL